MGFKADFIFGLLGFAIQLANTLYAFATLQEPLIFVSGDNRLLTAALAEGFPTDNPYLHP